MWLQSLVAVSFLVIALLCARKGGTVSEDPGLDAIKAHISACQICSAADSRVNDFCEEGRLMFYKWAETHPPFRAEQIELTPEQYQRLVAERRRKQKPERN